jgi:hypothetical protein
MTVQQMFNEVEPSRGSLTVTECHIFITSSNVWSTVNVKSTSRTPISMPSFSSFQIATCHRNCSRAPQPFCRFKYLSPLRMDGTRCYRVLSMNDYLQFYFNFF